MTRILPIFLICACTKLFAQPVFIKGNITDAETGQGVSFAHIGICGKSIGTVANELGLFEFRIPADVAQDSLCASAIGYETFRIFIPDIQDNFEFKILLKPQVSYLSDVLIKEDRITARRIIAKAITRINKNYPVKPYVLEGYYRDYLRRNDEYISFLEGVLLVNDQGFRTPSDKSDISIRQLRYSKDYIRYFAEYVSDFDKDSTKLLIHGISPQFKGNEFSNLYYHNPIRNHNISVPFIGIFDTFDERGYDYEIEYYTYLEGKEVCVINVAPNKNFKFSHVSIKGKLYIRTDNYAIVKFNYAYFVTKRLETRKWFELNIEYREFQKKMYLKYFSFMNYYKLLTIDDIVEMAVFREFFVTNIYPGGSVIQDDSVIINERLPLYLQNASNDAAFWNTFSRTLLEQPLMD